MHMCVTPECTQEHVYRHMCAYACRCDGHERVYSAHACARRFGRSRTRFEI